MCLCVSYCQCLCILVKHRERDMKLWWRNSWVYIQVWVSYKFNLYWWQGGTRCWGVIVWVGLKWQIELTVCKLRNNMSLSHQVNHQFCKIHFVHLFSSLLFSSLLFSSHRHAEVKIKVLFILNLSDWISCWQWLVVGTLRQKREDRLKDKRGDLKREYVHVVGERKNALVLISTKRPSERTYSFTLLSSMTTMASDFSLKSFLSLPPSLSHSVSCFS